LQVDGTIARPFAAQAELTYVAPRQQCEGFLRPTREQKRGILRLHGNIFGVLSR
jgi:hypothetical protein